MKNILIRVDSSYEIGFGHVMRDLVLTQKFLDDKVIFASQNLEGNLNSKILKEGFDLKVLNSNNVEELSFLIKREKIDMLIIDCYSIDYIFEKKLKEKHENLKVLSFDDTYEKHYCDILLNHNVYAKENLYEGLVPKACKLRCGSKYALIREEFKDEKGKVYNNIKPFILISMGATDPSNTTCKTLALLQKLDINIKVLTTKANINLSKLLSYENKTIKILVDCDKIARQINSSLFVICSPSVVCSEVMFLSKDFISIKTAQNQNMMHEYLKENNYVVLEKFDNKILMENIQKLLGKVCENR